MAPRCCCRDPGFTVRQRNSYFTTINLIGVRVFNFVEDNHHQRDGVVEAEAARVDDMIDSIRRTGD